jgi:hypothetical protein
VTARVAVAQGAGSAARSWAPGDFAINVTPISIEPAACDHLWDG